MSALPQPLWGLVSTDSLLSMGLNSEMCLVLQHVSYVMGFVKHVHMDLLTVVVINRTTVASARVKRIKLRSEKRPMECCVK